MILILADAFDTHADSVASEIAQLEGRAFRLNLDVEALKQTRLISDPEGWLIEQSGNLLHQRDVAVVWARRLTLSQTLDQKDARKDPGQRLWSSEWNRALYGFYAGLRERDWINPIQASSLADNKIYQISVASRVGLDCPEYLISNSRSHLIEFADQHSIVALKFMSQDMYKDRSGRVLGLYVNRLMQEDLEYFGSDEENPVTLQRYIAKSFEVRYTVVGEEHFVCAIGSQSSLRANVDWRRYDVPNTPHWQIDPPEAVRRQVSELMRELGLFYGALDFIVDVDEKWWFLEVNTAGQWLWIEDLAGLAISNALARALVERSGRDRPHEGVRTSLS